MSEIVLLCPSAADLIGLSDGLIHQCASFSSADATLDRIREQMGGSQTTIR